MVQDLGSDNFINIFAVSGHLYLDFYEQTKDKSQLKDAKNLFSIAAKLFNEYYLQKNKYLKISRLKLNLKLFYKKSTFLVD